MCKKLGIDRVIQDSDYIGNPTKGLFLRPEVPEE